MDVINKERPHKSQQLFIQYYESELAQKLRDMGKIEEVSCWSETQKHSQNTYLDVSIPDSSIIQLDLNDINNQNKDSISQEQEKIEVVLVQQESTTKSQRDDRLINNLGQKELSIISNNGMLSSIQSKQKLSNYKYGLNQIFKNTKLDSDSNQNIYKRIDNRKKQKSANFTGFQITSNIKVLMKLKQKVLYFFHNHTYLGRTKNLNRQIRHFINDQSDVILSENRINRFLNNSNFIYQISKYLEQKNIPVINSQTKEGNIISFLFIIYNCLFLLIYSLFVIFSGVFEGTQYFFPITQFIWVVQVFVKLNTSIYIKGKIVENRKKIFFNYLKNKFLFDLLPIIAIGTYDQKGWIVLVQILAFLKAINISADLSQFQKYLCIKIKKYYIVQLVNLMLMLFLIAHILACIWYLLALIEIHYLDEKTWIDDSIGADGVWWKIYLWALYWALTLMTTGSNTATTVLQTIFTSFIMLFTTIIFGYLLNVIGVLLQDMDSKDEQMRKDINIINDFMRQKNITPQILLSLFQSSIQYFNYLNQLLMENELKIILMNIQIYLGSFRHQLIQIWNIIIR